MADTRIEQVEQSGAKGDGNTKRRPIQSKHWCFTLNNYTKTDVEQMEQTFQVKCKKYVFQEETGENGTPHLQGYIELNKKERFNTIINNTRIHWENCRSPEHSIQYCQKEDTRTGKIYKYGFPKPLKLITELRDWQTDIDNILKTEPDDRKIYWYYDTEGGIGKSAFTKYCVVKYNTLPLKGGRYSDMINIVYNYLQSHTEIESVIIDIPRSQGNSISYDTIEDIKNGLIVNTKYETGTVAFNPPHVIIFCNEAPDTTKLSKDRWIIKNITNYTDTCSTDGIYE